eukprot:8687453-Pyramimonas_sp.AAC.1
MSSHPFYPPRPSSALSQPASQPVSQPAAGQTAIPRFQPFCAALVSGRGSHHELLSNACGWVLRHVDFDARPQKPRPSGPLPWG